MTIQPFYFIVAVVLFSCNEAPCNTPIVANADTAQAQTLPTLPSSNKKPEPSAPSTTKTYANQRFRSVTIQKTGDNKYTIKGEAQIFEANFSWVVEDGHDELLSGHEMTDAGAPEWGDFSFTIEVAKKRANSTLTLVLYEVSAKDGSRQHELPIVLE